MGRLERLRILLIKAEKFLIVVMFGLMLFLVILDILLRSIFQFGFFWSNILSQSLFIWGILFAGVLGLEKGEHFSVDFLVKRYFPGSAKKVVSLIGDILITAFVSIYLYSSILFIICVRSEIVEVLRIPKFVLFLGIPISAFLMLVHLGLKAVLRNYDSKKEEGKCHFG